MFPIFQNRKSWYFNFLDFEKKSWFLEKNSIFNRNIKSTANLCSTGKYFGNNKLLLKGKMMLKYYLVFNFSWSNRIYFHI